MGNHKSTHVRVERDLLNVAKMELPLYTPSEIFKAGYISLKAYNKAGKFIYGKKLWDNKKK